MPILPRPWTMACLALHLLGATLATSAPVELPGYQSADEFETALQSLGESDIATVTSLGKTAEQRDIQLVTLGTGDWAAKPAVLVMGSVDAANLVGSELSLRMAQQLSTRYAEGDEAAIELLDAVTLYFIPRPSPDASAHVLDGPTTGRATNTRSTDDDRDGKYDEDPTNDLNDDGVITMMRVADPAGPWMEHPDEPRLLVRADIKKKEAGKYQLYSEGTDDDQDETWNEDGPGGVDFNRNLTFKYPYFKPGAGRHQVSEPETRAVVDWMFTQPNIFLVFSFAPQENLAKPWNAAKDNGGRIKQQVLRDDSPYYDYLSEMYVDNIGNKNSPDTAAQDGAFTPWAYFHYGRWSVASRGWWIPKIEPAKPDDEKTDEQEEADEEADDEPPAVAEDEADADEDAKKESAQDPAAESDDEPEAESSTDEAATEDEDQSDDDKTDEEKSESKKPDTRNADEVNALAWFAQEGIEGFVEWQEVEHPDFPGKQVEVGGFKPLLREHPPADDLDELATRHAKFLADTIALRAKLAFGKAKVETLGAGVYRIQATVINQGYLPTVSSMGRTAGKLQRLEIELKLPEGSKVLVGDRRQTLGTLDGGGGNQQAKWLVRLPAGTEKLELQAGEPSVGYCQQTIELNKVDEPQQAEETEANDEG
ncbi:M14 family metallopeptidase [Aeoliella sp. ICT_H6.2]|uniref:M14 family metallopeptidase n=1 Tax=Aeoliella straminimaris TaxID=2954799 RepID=A0A9X2JFI6_9BACT|nr:M14 family metallopeptidase [Aeoliella straminimaris]MCO6042478.1 M14 family metallopeptidase [Aeoliella straminimaris]